VIEAADGAQADQIFDRLADSIDLVISDLVMPGLSGRALTERIRKRKPDMDVLLVSGYLDAQGESWSLEAEPDFLPKPFSASELIDKVHRILLRRKAGAQVRD
jgi:DNA-binding response OmpR family regulator